MKSAMCSILAVGISTVFFACAHAGHDDHLRLFHSEDECPSVDQLNATTLYWHMSLEDSLASDPAFREWLDDDQRQSLSFQADLPVLKTESHQAQCQAINEKLISRYAGFHNVPDREKGVALDAYYWIIYAFGDSFLAVVAPYSPGEEDLSRVGGPSGGVVRVVRFDRKLEVQGVLAL